MSKPTRTPEADDSQAPSQAEIRTLLAVAFGTLALFVLLAFLVTSAFQRATLSGFDEICDSESAAAFGQTQVSQ